MAQLLLRGLADDGARYRVREVLFEAGGEAQHLFAAASAEGHDLRDARLCGGQRACLVEDRGVGLRHSLDVLAALYQHAVFDALAHRGEYRERRRYLYRAGVVDHYRRRRALRAAREEIDRRGEREVVGHYRVGELFGLALDARLAPLGFFYDFDYFVYPRGPGDGFHFYCDFAFFDRGPRVDARPGAADYAERLAGHRGLVDDRLPFGDRAVGRYYRACADYEHVARAQLGEGYLNLRAVLLYPDFIDAQRKALSKVFLRAVLRPRLHFFGERHERHYNAGGRNVAAQYRAGYGGGVKYGYVEPPQEEKSLQPARDVGCGAPQAYYAAHFVRQKKHTEGHARGRAQQRRDERRAAPRHLHALVVFARHYGYGG